MHQRRVQKPLTPYVAWTPTQQQVQAGIAALEIEPVPERKPRKKRSKQEQVTNPYEWKIQRNVVTSLRLVLPLDYIVQANVQEREGSDAGGWAKAQGQQAGWPDIGVYGDGKCWLIEMKDAEGYLNAAQEKMHPRIIAAGIPLLPICRSYDQAIEFLIANGARTRISA